MNNIQIIKEFALDLDSAVKAIRKNKDDFVEFRKGEQIFTFRGSRETFVSIWAYLTMGESKELELQKKLADRCKLINSKEEGFELLDALFYSIRLYNKLFFKTARELMGLNQDEMALKLSWSKQQVSNIEGGVRDLQLQTKLAIECLLIRSDKFEEFKEIFPFCEGSY